MEKITKALLENALAKPDSQSRKQLPKEEFLALGIMLERTARRYPSQENADSMKEYMLDFEQLALKYSLRKIEAAIESLRIAPGQAFFPKPNEVAEQIERSIESGRYAADIADGIRRRAADERERDREYRLYGDWRKRWEESGLPLSKFFAKEDAEKTA